MLLRHIVGAVAALAACLCLDIATARNASLEAAGSGHVQWKIRYGQERARGVNLGGWLVSEKWMTEGAPMWNNMPANAVGEYQTIAWSSDRNQRRAAFEDFHKTFVMEKDIAALAQAGINTVRVPVGYWITGSDPYDPSGRRDWDLFPKDTLACLDKLIKEWAWNHKVAVLISIHAAKGSQNGEDHSAATDKGQAYWSQYPENVKNTIFVAEFLAKRYKDDDAFLGLGLLNEPTAQTNEAVLNQYYLDAYRAVRATGTDCVLSIMPLLYKQSPDNLVGFMEAPAFYNVWVEWHPYFIWGSEHLSPNDLVNWRMAQEFQGKLSAWINRPNANKMFFGEWSFANSGQFPNVDTPEYLNFARTMMNLMKQASAGWAYWSWRIYGDDWSGVYNPWSIRSVLNKPSMRSILMG